MVRHLFWSHEAWVAVTTRFPLSQLPATTSSTPIGWSVLVRTLAKYPFLNLRTSTFLLAVTAFAYFPDQPRVDSRAQPRPRQCRCSADAGPGLGAAGLGASSRRGIPVQQLAPAALPKISSPGKARQLRAQRPAHSFLAI